MSAVHRGLGWTTRQAVLRFAALMAAAAIAGGAGGYLIRGGSTGVVAQSTPAIGVREQAVTGPLTEPHDAIPARGPSRDSQSGYGASSAGSAGYEGLNGDSAGGY